MIPLPAFNQIQFRRVEREGKPWITSPDLARALGYRQTDSVSRLYDRNKDEFTPAMTAVELLRRRPANDDRLDRQIDGQRPDPQNEGQVIGNPFTETRIFSLRGAHLVAMFAKTPIAAEFRRWVLDLLEHAADPPPAPPAPAATVIDAVELTRMSEAIGVMREARHVWTREECRTIWIKLGLPSPVADAAVDALTMRVQQLVDGLEQVMLPDLASALGMPADARSSLALGAALRLLGWESVRARVDGRLRYVWRRVLIVEAA